MLSRPPAWQLLLVFAVAVAAFSNSLHGDFVYDDVAAILENDDVVGVAPGLWSVWTHDFWGAPVPGFRPEASRTGVAWWTHQSYRPLTVLSLRACWWGGASLGSPARQKFLFHAFNVAAHALASCLVLLFLRRLYCLTRVSGSLPPVPSSGSSPSSPSSPPMPPSSPSTTAVTTATTTAATTTVTAIDPGRWVPLLASVLFAAHSVHVEAVSFVTGRAETLCACLCLASLIMYVDSVRATRPGHSHRLSGSSHLPSQDGTMVAGALLAVRAPATAPWLWRVAMSQVLALFAVLAKETGSTVFGVMVLIELVDVAMAVAGPGHVATENTGVGVATGGPNPNIHTLSSSPPALPGPATPPRGVRSPPMESAHSGSRGGGGCAEAGTDKLPPLHAARRRLVLIGRIRLARIAVALMSLVLYLGVRARVLGLTFDINMHGSFNRFAALQSQSGGNGTDETKPAHQLGEKWLSFGHLHARSAQLLLCVDDHYYDRGTDIDTLPGGGWAHMSWIEDALVSLAEIPLLCTDNVHNNRTRLQFNHNFLRPVVTAGDPRNAVTAVVYVATLAPLVVSVWRILRRMMTHLALFGSIGSSSGAASSGRRPPSILDETFSCALRIAFALAWAVAAYLPSSHVLFPAGFLVAERVLYLPSIGFCVAFVEALRHLILLCARAEAILQHLCGAARPSLTTGGGTSRTSGNAAQQRRRPRRAATVTLALVVAVLSTAHVVACWRRNVDWRDQSALYRSAIAADPAENCLALHGLATAQYHHRRSAGAVPPRSGRGRDEDPETLFRRALACDPTWGESAGQLGKLIYEQSGGARVVDALHWFRVAGDSTAFKHYASNAGVLLFAQAQQLRFNGEGGTASGVHTDRQQENKRHLLELEEAALAQLVKGWSGHNLRHTDSRVGYVLTNAACAFTHPTLVQRQLAAAEIETETGSASSHAPQSAALAEARMRLKGIGLLEDALRFVEADRQRGKGGALGDEAGDYTVPLKSGVSHSLAMAYDALLRPGLRDVLDNPGAVAQNALHYMEDAVRSDPTRGDRDVLLAKVHALRQQWDDYSGSGQQTSALAARLETSCQMFLL